MDRKSKIIIYSSLLIILLSVGMLYRLQFGFPRHPESENYLWPTRQGNAIWISENGDSWFEVTNKDYCIGELNFKGETISVCYEFETDNTVAIFSIENNQISIKDGEVVVPEGAETFYGTCELFKNKITIKLCNLDDLDYSETITLYKD